MPMGFGSWNEDEHASCDRPILSGTSGLSKVMQALDLIKEMHDDGCLAMHPNPQGSDYHCRYCDRPTKSHIDFTIIHHSLCVWPRIQKLQNER